MEMSGQQHSGTHWIGVCVGRRSNLDAMEKTLTASGFEPRHIPTELSQLITFAVRLILHCTDVYDDVWQIV
jgi:hypothetical protein